MNLAASPRYDETTIEVRGAMKKTERLSGLPDCDFFAGRFSKKLLKTLDALSLRDLTGRFWKKDPSLWSSIPEVQEKIRERLGWQTLFDFMAGQKREISAFVSKIVKDGFKDLVVIGMGGSSLCPEFLARTFGGRRVPVRVRILDTTDPGAILRLEKTLDLTKTLFLLASKSGGTLEMVSLYYYFDQQLRQSGIAERGSRFAAITDEGSSLSALARKENFYALFLNPSDIGGRFSALSSFGLVPGAVAGLDIEKFLERGLEMAGRCRNARLEKNPGFFLGAVLGSLSRAGADKATFFLPPEISGLGAWLEQLLAESSGKEGNGIVPVDGEPWGEPGKYGNDRLFVFWQIGSKKNATVQKRIRILTEKKKPVILIRLNNLYDLAGEFFRWEVATAVAGIVQGINPFDEPNVSESKENSRKILLEFEEKGRLPVPAEAFREKGISLLSGPMTSGCATLKEALKKFFRKASSGKYAALLAYLEPSDENSAGMTRLRKAIREQYRIATTAGFGPRFLHSTGQLHKGGKPSGLFIQVTADDPADFSVPGRSYTFGSLKNAQALGDAGSLSRKGLPLLQFHFHSSHDEGWKTLTRLIKGVK